MDEAIEAANEIASEHMEIVTKNPFEDMMKVRNAGAIFIGEHSSEPLGDYFAGPNHVLPTNGTAKFFSALSVEIQHCVLFQRSTPEDPQGHYPVCHIGTADCTRKLHCGPF